MQPSIAPIRTTLLVLAIAVGGLPVGAAAQTTDIESAREQARRLEREIEELGARASAVLEEYHQAEAALAQADEQLFATRQEVEEVRRRHEHAQHAAQERVVRIYQGRSAPTLLSYVDAEDLRELAAKQHYAGSIVQRDRAVLRELSDSTTLLREEENQLAEERDEFAAQERALRTKRDEVDSAMAEREDALSQAQGELAQLVEEERQRRAAEEEARLREELARRRAAEEARRLAATTTTSTTAPQGSGGSVPTTSVSEPPAPRVAPARSGPAPAVHPNADVAVQTAMDQIGKPYQWAGNGPERFDCSGLTSFAWRAAGVALPRSSGLQKAALPPVTMDEVQPGDLLFFGEPVHHVGLYVGDGKMVNAPYTGTTVRVDSIYRRDFNGAGRPG